MMIILSPSKGQDFTPAAPSLPSTQPEFLEQANQLITALRKYNLDELRTLMGISQPLAERTRQQIRDFTLSFSPDNAKQALFAFDGQVYRNIKTATYPQDTLLYAQEQLRILSGLYGCLRPLDLIQPYRLEMGYKMSTSQAANLYTFWGERITKSLNRAMHGEKQPVVINLASNEYTRVINKKQLHALWIDVQFKEEKNGKLQTVVVYAKRARGMMADVLLRNRITHPSDIEQVACGGYTFSKEYSKKNLLLFTRSAI
jgi:cytoplasmic iron level regulating protein YaaA (DUF328/UPF0246 family)